MSDRIRVFTALNHQGNEFECLKVTKKYPVKFSYLRNNVRRWSKFSGRPEPTTWLTPDEFEWVDFFDPSQYDLAILRLDQQHSDANLGKSQLSRQLMETIGTSLPVVFVNHGTPMVNDLDEDIVKFGGEAHTQKGLKRIDGIKDLVKDAKLMIVNSYDAVQRWEGVHENIYPLLHGMDKNEWISRPKEPRVILPLSPGGLDKYYNRSLCTAIKGAVKERTGLDVIHFNVNLSFEQDNWTQYRDFVSRSLISIFPFLDSPMPRSRSESMFCSNVVLSSRHHNASEFIQNGVNGFILPDNPLSYAEVIDILLQEGYREGLRIGERARETAIKFFDIDDFLGDFYHVLYEVANGRTPKWDGRKRWENKQ